MSRAALRAASLAAALLLVACTGEEFGDLKAELNEKSKDFRGRVDALPQVKPYEPVPYTAEGVVDPFRPDRIDVAGAPRATRADMSKMAPDLNRPKEPLEAFPLESLQLPRQEGQLHGPELRRRDRNRRGHDQPQGIGAGRARGMGGAC